MNGVNGVNDVNGVDGLDHTAKNTIEEPPRYQLLVWSARDEAALKRMLDLYDEYAKTSMHGDVNFISNLAYTLAERRSLMAWRSFVVVDSHGAPEVLNLSASKCERASRDIGVAFVFTGQGAQYVNMGIDLLRYPKFKAMLSEIDNVFKELGAEWSLFGKYKAPFLAHGRIR